MAKLILSLDGTVLREYTLEKNAVSIGRKPNNDLQIDNLAVSGNHARVDVIGSDVFLEDLDSTNGTLVNGQTVKRQMLQNGDMIEMGKYKLKYVSEGTKPGLPDDFDKTMVIKPGALKPTAPAGTSPLTAHTEQMPIPVARPAPAPAPQAAAAEAAAPAAGEVRPGAIKVLSGGNAGKTLDLVKNLTSLGKPGVQVAIITKRPTGYFITHVEGPSHPLVNGREIGVHAELLADKAVIELAGVKMEFFYK
ncbi:FHA domain-containing protein [Chitinimonas sp.]|uniref:FHA domain-containing protein n=1 Tax=Chitinimonas sp. TaxID=1934313 RepID=UPI002F93B714